ncbi:MAG: DNA polymerase/3'-5' exonuclease PolX [Puniceicoccaceae bacterium]|nr:MAG: DNA polymerase/3'-5' exonuclease PolX [Puniceicoccaceae bacterium]
MDSKAIAEALEEIALLLEIKGENPFKVRAYQTAARTLENLEEDLGVLIDEGRLSAVKGIGSALTQKIEELHRTGSLDYLDELRASMAPGLMQLLEIPGLGGKKVKVLHDKLGVDSIESLRRACEAGDVAKLAGFGEKTQAKLLQGIANREAYGKRHLWWDAFAVAEPILEGLRGLPEVVRAEHAGSLRRRLETVGDLDFIAAAEEAEPVMEWFTSRPGILEVTARGSTKSSIRLEGGLQADLRVVPPAQFPFALHHFTGSKDHNVALRQRALARGLSLSEWGLSPAEGREKRPVKVPPPGDVQTEEDLFRLLGLTHIPPELREGMGEIEAAEANDLPELLRAEDLRGAIHNHTTASDGRNTLEEMAAAADELGWDYLGIADHSKASFQANGLDEKRLLRQVAAIRELNEAGTHRVRILAGVECDLLSDGSLDLSDEVLGELDYVVLSIHSGFSMDEAAMTRRVLQGLENPHVSLLGHPTGRLLLQRESYRLDVPAVIEAAAERGVALELNANPRRLDLDWRWWRTAASKGVKCCICPDAHHAAGLAYLEAGVGMARKGWLRAADVLNTRPLPEFLEHLQARRKRARW